MEPASTTASQMPQIELTQLLREGKTDGEIHRILYDQFGTEHLVKPLMEELKKLRRARAITAGLVLLVAGGLILVTSCGLTIMKFYSGGSMSMVLYGLTSFGILVIFGGLIKIFS